MLCPFCSSENQRVLDSRPARDGTAIRRRRECAFCGRRFTTFEEIEKPSLFVVKRSGARELFLPAKCLNSMLIACRKRRIPIDCLRDAVGRIEQKLLEAFDVEVPSSVVGEYVLAELKAIDVVAYIRFASVYREFESVADFEAIIDRTKSPAGSLQ